MIGLGEASQIELLTDGPEVSGMITLGNAMSSIFALIPEECSSGAQRLPMQHNLKFCSRNGVANVIREVLPL